MNDSVPAQSRAEAVADLMAELRNGNKAAANRLVALFYPELRRLAAAHMRSERAEHSWQPTVLVNELYLELLKIKTLRETPAHSHGAEDTESEERGQKEAFFGLAAHLMKRLLIHHARPLAARSVKVPAGEEVKADSADVEELQELDSILARLAEIDPKLRSVVEMKVFEDLSIDEMAAELGCSRRSIVRYWRFARQWLQEQLER